MSTDTTPLAPVSPRLIHIYAGGSSDGWWVGETVASPEEEPVAQITGGRLKFKAGSNSLISSDERKGQRTDQFDFVSYRIYPDTPDIRNLAGQNQDLEAEVRDLRSSRKELLALVTQAVKPMVQETVREELARQQGDKS